VRLNLPHYCIVNILKNKRVFPELIEHGFNPENLALQLEKMHQGEQRESCLKDCEDLVEFFSKDQAEKKAALSIKSVL
jgi:lipid-A-disaccharide synthase